MFKMIPAILLALCCTLRAANAWPDTLKSDFFQLPLSEQMQQFKAHTLEEQYDLFIYGNQVRHPPAIHLARSFAEQGPVIVPFLRTKLETATNELTVRDIALVFSELARLKLDDFSKDPDLMALLDRRANAMRGQWKDTTLDLIAQIRIPN